MQFHKTRLKNGLRVITIPTKGNPSVTVMVVAETGSDYEEKSENGLSHFLEHMCFKGTTKRPSSIAISQELDSIGANQNAFTSNEMTAYHAKASRKHFTKVLDVIADMYLDPALPPDDIEKERGVILQEISMYEDIPQKQVWKVFRELMYGDTPSGRSILGTPESVKKFARKDFLDYLKRYYVAKKTIVVVAGDVKESEVLKEVKEKFQAIKDDKVLHKPKLVESQKEPAVKIQRRKTDQAHMLLGFRAFGSCDKRIPTLNIVSTILGGGMSSRLFHKLRDEMGACYYVKVAHEENLDYGSFIIATGINASRAEEVTEAIVEELVKLKETLVSDEELEKAKEYHMSHLHMGLETTDALAEYYAIHEVATGKPKTPAEEEKEIRAVTAEDVQKLAKELFAPQGANLAIVGDVKSGAGLKKILHF